MKKLVLLSQIIIGVFAIYAVIASLIIRFSDPSLTETQIFLKLLGM